MFLGIDIGTSAVKALIAGDDQRVIASATVPLAISRPHPLWAEQSPDDWWLATEAAVGQLRQQAGPQWSGIKAIGLSGQMHGAVLLDGDGVPLRSAILWNDGRSEAEALELNQRLPSIGTIAGVPAMASFMAPKLLWLKAHEPEVMASAARLLLPKDYVRLRMTGTYATDMCDAAGSLLLDCGKRQWSDAIISACGISKDMLPDVLEGSSPSGQLWEQVAQSWGLQAGIMVAAGSGDAAAGALGIGAINEGDAFVSLGTSGQYFITRGKYNPAPQHLIHTFCFSLPERWFQMAALLNGASCLSWVADLLGQSNIDQLLARTEAGFRGPSSVTFLPYLSGERTPHNNPRAKGVLFGLTPSTSPEDVVLAVMEGVALSFADCQAYLAGTGTLPGVIGAIGGGTKSRFWMGLLASALGRTIVLYEGGETGPAFGAARLARLALTGEAPDEICTKPAVTAEIAPDPALAQAYGERLVKFQSLYQSLSGQF